MRVPDLSSPNVKCLVYWANRRESDESGVTRGWSDERRVVVVIHREQPSVDKQLMLTAF
ncbi:hypothetical protein J6590_071953 [Homalodisca vitripennis]|nr:hypothetical protein J6590_071953 [Homalodisca vitripennis]